jgi:hypothetical protein
MFDVVVRYDAWTTETLLAGAQREVAEYAAERYRETWGDDMVRVVESPRN